MGQYRTSSLFHYTKSIDILPLILTEGLIPNYCYEDLSYKGNPTRGIGVPMICFCDIPLSQTNLFVKRYGEYAIGLNKEWAKDKRINPILYAKDENILISLAFQKAIEVHFENQLQEYGGNKWQVSFDLTPGSKPQLAAFFNLISSHSANQSIHGMVKKYCGEHNGKIQINYEENEWRYLVEDTKNTPWFWNKKEYDEWRGDHKNSPKPNPSENLIRKKLEFKANDVAFIIVSKEEEISQMIKHISKMSSIANAEITEEDKLMLYTRIISFERIQKDF